MDAKMVDETCMRFSSDDAKMVNETCTSRYKFDLGV